MITNPVSSITRQEVNDSWRRLEEIQIRYREATEQYRKLLQEHDERPCYASAAFARARRAESQALVEYTRRLRIFTQLTMRGKMPDKRGVEG
jgi:hypothetical protein